MRTKRLGAALVDWAFVGSAIVALSTVAAYSPLPIVTVLAGIAMLLTPLVYFTGFWSRGSSPGMAVVGIRVVDDATGGSPGFIRAGLRSGFSLLAFASGFFLGVAAFSDSPAKGFEFWTTLGASSGVLLASVGARIWTTSDAQGRGRTLIDRICRIAVLRPPTASPPQQP